MRELVALIRSRGYTISQFATAAGIPEARLIEILFTGRFLMREWLTIEETFGMKPRELDIALGKSPCDFIPQRKKQPGKVIRLTDYQKGGTANETVISQ